MPWQLLVQVIAQKVEYVHPHAAVFHQFSIRRNILKISGNQQLEKDHGVDRRGAGIAIEFLRVLIKKT
tara:strand:+ start:292 stop:495 length:204 start_codon:yes stop_codon:yes gene_type:complete